MLRALLALLGLGGVMSIALAFGAAQFVQRELDAPLPIGAPVLFEIASGESARATAMRLRESGVSGAPSWVLDGWVRWQRPVLRTGEYQLQPGDTTRSALARFATGSVVQRSVTVVEGVRFLDLLQTFRSAGRLHDDLAGLNEPEIMERIGYPGHHPEGRFFPDTYAYEAQSTLSDLLRRAADRMEQEVSAAWTQRADDLPLQAPEELLILASIVEKETGREADRARIAGVFAARLRKGMRLQTDPTVIYGLGDEFDGNLTRKHLRTDQPWNTYTRAGLPPTPICLPGRASLIAAAQPDVGDALYFVARGDGTTQFSATLQDHQAAVRRFQLGGRRGG